MRSFLVQNQKFFFMLNLSHDQVDGLKQDKRVQLIERIDTWLLNEDRAWPRVAIAQRHEMLDQIFDYAEQSGMQSERDFAVFSRATILMRADWKAFVEADPQKELLLDENNTVKSKLRAYYNRCEITARGRT